MADFATENDEISQQQQPNPDPPIHMLPNEILQRIFLEACDDIHGVSALQMDIFPWIAGQVCGRWRQIVLFLPQLWNNWNLQLQTNDEKISVIYFSRGFVLTFPLPQSAVQIMGERLLRCRNFPLTFRVSVIGTDEENPTVERLLNAIGDHSEQWKEACLFIGAISLTHLLLNQIQGRLSRLEKLEWNSLPEDLPKAIVAPSLVDLAVHGISSTRSFPWSQLQRITLRASQDQTMDDLRVLQPSQHLVQIQLESDTLPHLRPELKFDQLRALSCSSSALHVFLELPALEELRLSNDTTLEALPAFIQRTSSSPTLRSLIFPSVSRPDGADIMIDALNMLPGLTTLDMSCILHTGIFYAVLKHLCVDPARPDRAILRNLRHISFSLQSDSPENIQALTSAWLEMIESRISTKDNFPGLKSVEWTDTHRRMPGFPELMKIVEDLGKRGLQVTLRPRF
ncbi:hypothetical protein C8J56DRAFT_963832 [Mycena floridula]|nr:hypothetical protein C8J56DRAFT_963832 [Mycena floridula]